MAPSTPGSPSPSRRRLGPGCSFVVAVGMIGLMLVLRSVGLESFDVPSGSMEPTLRIGDSILVSKSHYGLRLPFTRWNLTGPAVPARGDVVVFIEPGTQQGAPTDTIDLLPVFPTDDTIKRVVGLPGETVAVKDGVVWIDGRPSARSALGPYRYVDAECTAHPNTRQRETIGGHRHVVLEAQSRRQRRRDHGPTTVPPGHVFVLGDQRDRSRDSRSFGPVPVSAIKGKAVAVWLSVDGCDSDAPLRTQRIGRPIE